MVEESVFLQHCLKCSKCPSSSCCYYEDHEGFIALGVKEAQEIKEKTGLDFKEFLEFSPLSPAIIEECRNDPPQSEGEMRYQMLQNHRLLRLKTKKHHCVFLDEKYHCKIYPFRPLICSMYPFWYKINDGKVEIIPHDPDTDCAFVRDGIHVPPATIEKLKKIAAEIEEEKKNYPEQIGEFVNKNGLI